MPVVNRVRSARGKERIISIGRQGRKEGGRKGGDGQRGRREGGREGEREGRKEGGRGEDWQTDIIKRMRCQ